MSDRDISVLNSLTKTTLDSMKGFEEAAKDAEATQFASVFAEFARDRSQVASALQAEVRRLGGQPEEDSSFLAAAHRTFMDLKQALYKRRIKVQLEKIPPHCFSSRRAFALTLCMYSPL